MRRRELAPKAVIGLAMVKAMVLGSLLAMTVGFAVDAAADQQVGPRTVTNDSYTQVVQRVMTKHRCSTSGFATETEPSSALITNSQGKLRMVSFEKGWDVFTGHRPGTLVAVCLAEKPNARM